MKFVNIYNETEENMRLALLSLWTPGSHPMRQAIEQLLKDEPLLAEPVFQSTFGWEPTHNQEWRNSLNKDVINKLGIGAVHKPYKHQAESWKALSDNKSIVVTSGTGSGKTECFMYPVLSDLYEEENTNSIQAIFLYPLNALMEDQKKRLSSYCAAIGLKFAVYNGDTPEYRADGRDEVLNNEVITRDEIRDTKHTGTRPQILLTNPSMLEYILVRQKDQEMLHESAGKLRWIVIDEAHSYSGSAAIELAYQIKRILEAFQVKAEDVRFACTSATIGGEEGSKSLAEFISTVTGQPTSQIKVIGGNRLIPSLDEDLLSKTLNEKGLPSVNSVVSLRKKINEVAGMNLRQMWEWLHPEQPYLLIPALELLDSLCELSQGKASVLSLRAHFFMRAISGLYACANDNCKNSSRTLYGHLTTYKSATCPKCGVPLLEIVQCKRCGGFVLMGSSDSQSHKISPCEDGRSSDDYFSIDLTPEQEEDEEQNSNGQPNTFFLLPYEKEKFFNPVGKAHVETVNLIHKNQSSIFEVCPGREGKWVEVRKDDGHSYCPSCGRLAKGKRLNLKHFRIPINFINQTIAPVFLHECAPDGRSWGKYIAFTDSRQGTAISAKTFNINVERIQSRERTMQLLADRGGEEVSLNCINLDGMDNATRAAVLAMHKQLMSKNAQSENISLEKICDSIFDRSIFEHITVTDGAPDKQAYKAALIRNFIGRKPLYETNIETMGLATLEYPALNQIKMPSSLIDYVDAHGLDIKDQDWRDYLKLLLDYFVRMGNHIQPLIDGERKYVRDSNLSTPIAGPDDPQDKVTHWPSLKMKDDGSLSTQQPRMVVLLCVGLGIDSIDKLQKQARLIQHILNNAWAQLVKNKVLTKVKADDSEGYNNTKYYSDNRYVGCYFLDLSSEEANKTCTIKRTKSAWECPVTKKLLDTLFCGYSPLIDGEISRKLFEKYHCAATDIKMPERPTNNELVQSWIKSDENVKYLSQLGLWSDRHKYAYKKSPAYIAAEHSAQQSKKILREYTKAFSQTNPAINVLHCSTTMEMGVDIGDIDVVLMDTIPPTAANYLQRVGRAGRKGQSKAIAFSLCNNTPVGQYAFANPMWALQATNHMIKVRESQTIIQRHVNSFFFRQFICDNGVGIQATMSVDEFMLNTYDSFVEFLNAMSTNKAEECKFHSVFGYNVRFTIDVTLKIITDIHDKYNAVIKELDDVFDQYPDDVKRQMAISNQIKKCKQEGLLNYLSEHQFIPNANMPTGVVTFDFTDRDQFFKLNKLYTKAEKLQNEIESAKTPSEKFYIETDLKKVRKEIAEIRRSTSASRDIHTALNEYAPEQTVVVNEKNYVSAGIVLFGAYNEATQTRAIYHCTHCGHTDYSSNLDEKKICPVCNNPYHSIIDKDNGSYTRAYEPIGFRTDQNVDSSREEKTEKKFYDIRPVLLKTDWTKPTKVNMCEITSSGEAGNILFYNVGSGHGFAFCKRCGRAAVEYAMDSSEATIPPAVKPGHNRLWGNSCDANNVDIARHVVFTSRHQTCYSVLRFLKDVGSKDYENDEQLTFSMGVVITRALAKSEGIEEGEIDFGIKQELKSWVLFIYDTAKGGCGYSLKLTNPTDCQEIFDIAKKDLEDSPCHCEEDGGACAKCLVDRNNYRYSNKLSKAKALDWLNRQKNKAISIPSNVKAESPNAKVAYQPLKSIALQAVSSSDTSAITFCVSDNTSDYAITDWCSVRSEMGRIIRRALENGIKISIKVEYHPEYHLTLGDKLPFIDLQNKFPDCDIELIYDMGKMKTALIVETANKQRRYFTDQDNVLSFSNKWGTDCIYLFVDCEKVDFIEEVKPTYTASPSEIVREGITTATAFCVGNYFSQAIAPGVLKQSDIDLLASILRGKHVDITFSDMYVNSALSSLMFVYLIEEMKKLFGFKIENITLQLDSPRRKCINERFNSYTHICMNFNDKDKADKYTDNLIMRVLEVDTEHSDIDADHHRWLRIVNEAGDSVEIRPDHGISGGWKSLSTYMNLDTLDENVRVFKTNEDVLYYIIIKRNNG